MSGEVVESEQTVVEDKTEKHVTTRIPGLNGGTLTPFNSERSQIALQKRWGKHRRKAAEAILGEVASTNPDIKDEYDAYGYLVGIQASIAMQPGGTASEMRASTEAFKVVRSALGADVGAPARSGGGDTNTTNNVIMLSDKASEQLIRLLGGG